MPPDEWKIYYDDGTTFSDADGTPEDAPSYGIQIIAVHDEGANGRSLIRGFDYYWYSIVDNEFSGGNQSGMEDQFAHNIAKALKIGRAIQTKKYNQMFQRAVDDPETRVWLK